MVGRGLCLADFDNNGTVDFAVNNNGGQGEVWRTTVTAANSWIAFNLIGTKSNRDAVGAKITLTAGGITQFQQKLGGGSYASASDPRLFFGLGTARKADVVRVVWPSGLQQTFRDMPANQFVTVKEGSGIVTENRPGVEPLRH